jgi:hypothetical protein
MLAYKTLAH